ncbi:hypothetical protein BD408DRAFT_445880 [Parasitella parasitica]|nr:hypothetical protein BD408DRAFT_445880 [Parasitella parasitica]
MTTVATSVPYSEINYMRPLQKTSYKPQSNEKTSVSIDFKNLYVKNLDPIVTNEDFKNTFRVFGNVISARVMTNPQNGTSKGYGFVSFEKNEDAAFALNALNGKQFYEKYLQITYHTPKKKAIKGQPVISRAAYQHNDNPLKLQPSTPSLASPAIGTESNIKTQFRLFEKAIRQCGYHNDISDIVHMMMTLPRKERSLCLFNHDYLKEHIKRAKESLAVCSNEYSISSSPRLCSSPKSSLSGTISNFSFDTDIFKFPGKFSPIPIVKPPSHALDTSNSAKIEALLASLKGKTLNQKKNLVGAALFPLVKAIGTTHKNETTVYMLDNVPLEDLVSAMFDNTKLKARVNEAKANLEALEKSKLQAQKV